MQQVELNIPMLPPSVNNYWKRTKSGGLYLTPKAKIFKKAVWAIYNRLPEKRFFSKDLKVSVSIIFFQKRQSDIDNRIKAVLDSLQSVVFANDSQVQVLSVLQMNPSSLEETQIIISEFN
jgi:crossover junction endodeoxyribonuclease RusA